MTLPTALPANAALIPADALRAGTRLEDYEIDCVIARSAVAMVYRAVDRSSGQPVAIKEFLPTGLALRNGDGQVVAREPMHDPHLQRGRQVFLDTARTLARCDHASLMPVLRVMEGHGTVYKVMPFCPGPTLLEHRQKMAAAPAERLLRAWLEGLLGALAQWHAAGLVHGAVSPGNILMLADAGPVLLDCDAVYAAILSERTRSMIAALEPCFAPPEQCEPAPARPLGPWTDLYGLAASLRFCASGQLPGSYAPGPKRASAAAAGPPWLAALDACLAESAKDRPQSVAMLRKLLQAERPEAATAMVFVKAGLAPLLSVTVTPAAAPTAALQPLQAAAAPPVDAGRPLAAASPAALAEARESPADPGQREPADAATPRARSRWALAAGVGALVLAAMGAAALSLFSGQAQRVAAEAAAAQAALPPPPPPAPAPPSPRPDAQPAGVRPPAAKEVPAAVAKADAPADGTTVRRPVPEAAKSKPVAPNQPGTPVAARAQPGAASPRQACSGRERYALLQCMQEQCAKRAWSGHEQCVRLRKERRL